MISKSPKSLLNALETMPTIHTPHNHYVITTGKSKIIKTYEKENLTF